MVLWWWRNLNKCVCTCWEEGNEFDGAGEDDVVSEVGADIAQWKLDAVVVGVGSDLQHCNQEQYSQVFEVLEDS